MKTLIRNLSRVRPALASHIGLGVVVTLGGLIIAHRVVLLIGILAILSGAAALVATFLVDPVLEGQVLVREHVQQPQLPDVQTHTRRAKELAQAS